LRRLKEIYPDYSDAVAFYAVGTDPSESLEDMERYREQQGYPWPVAEADRSVLSGFSVFSQSTKVAFDGDGIIVYRDGYGAGDEETWRAVFEELAASN
jgi:hypothetical protein